MKRKRIILVIAFVMANVSLSVVRSQAMAENPCIRYDANGDTIYTADASAHVWADGRLYIYPSHDVTPPRSCDLMDRYHVFSTDDMVTWVDHGQILEASQVPWGRPEGGFMWAPDCAYKDGTYYFYFPHPSGTDWNNTWKVGIATSSEPAANFTVQGYLELPGDQHAMIDPTVFIDDDGQAYFYYGGGNRCMAGKLKDNMTELDGGLTQMIGLNDFHEAAWVHKYNGVYYLSYADNFNNGYTKNRLQYATSNSPLGPWSSKGVYLGGTTEGTNHGSIVEYKGQWYAFYHNNVLSAGLGYKGAARSVCVDKLFYNDNGTIQRVYHTGLSFPDPVVGVKNIPNTFLAENYTSGGEGITYHDTDAVNEGEIFRHDGVDIEPCSDGNANIFSIQAGEWIDYRLNVPNTASYKLEFRMSSPQGEGAFRVEVDGVDKTGRLTVPRTAGFQIWTTFSVTDIPLTAGVHTFRFVMEEAGFNFAGFAVSFAQPEIPVGKRITMKMGANYVTYNAQNQLVCNSPTITPECVFTVLQNGRFIELRAANGQYVSTASVKTPMTLTGNNQAADSKFLWHNLQANGQLFGLKSLKTNAVVCSENGTKAMNCDRYDFGGWEKFTWAEYAPVGIAALPVDARLPVYFDAARGELFLPEAAAGDWQIFDVSGRRMPGGKRSNSLSVPVSAFPAGMYIVKAGARTGKFIKH